MKKTICLIALAAICLGTVSASTPVKTGSDTTHKMKMKKKMGGMHHKMKMKKKMTKM
ncbi:MAG: hypothetical protein M3N14_02540 [Bacteroidota bacterium]|nr:hypothetical protein [Bacteroidota bacterium]